VCMCVCLCVQMDDATWRMNGVLRGVVWCGVVWLFALKSERVT